MTNREYLIRLLKKRVNFLANDCLTFIDVRNKKPLRQFPGGGNFLMVLGLFSLLNFLAKVYTHLNNPESFYSEDDKNTVKKIIEELPNPIKKIAKDAHTKWLLPRIGESLNEQKAFVNFIEILLSENIDLGINKIQAELIWKNYRNKLSHMAYPGSIIGTHQNLNLTNEKTLKYSLRNSSSFRIQNDLIICDADKLTLDIKYEILPWMCKYVEKASLSQINITTGWLRRTYN